MGITKAQICRVFQEIGVPYFTSGKNVSEDSVNIRCPFCPDDPSDHLGVFEGTGVFSCWRCKRKGPFVFLLRVITSRSEEHCQGIIDGTIGYNEEIRRDSEDIINSIINGVEEPRREVRKRQFSGIPEFFEFVDHHTKFPLLDNYLNRRHLHIDTLIDHMCGICRIGKFMNRMIIPITFNGEMVAFQAADMSKNPTLKYKTDGEINDFLYDYDFLGSDRIIVTEGVLDAWRVGKDATCTFGTHMTDIQMRLILNKKPKELIFAYDGDYHFEEMKMKSIPNQFTPFINVVKVVEFPDDHDPDSYGVQYGHDALMDLINNSPNI